jgi:hypothetical protein
LSGVVFNLLATTLGCDPMAKGTHQGQRPPRSQSEILKMIHSDVRRFGKFIAALGLGVCGFLASISPASGTLLISCTGCVASTIGGTPVLTSPTTTPPTLTVARSPNDNSGLPFGANLTMFVLVPDNAANGASLHFFETIFQGGNPIGTATTLCDLPCERPSMGAAAEWNTPGSSFLPSYWSDSQPSGPAILFDGLLAATRTVDPGANGYFVYAPILLVPVQFAVGADPTAIFAGSFPAGSIFGAFLLDSFNANFEPTGVVSRDAAGVALIVGTTNVPEPSTLLLLFASLVAACVVNIHSRSRRST